MIDRLPEHVRDQIRGGASVPTLESAVEVLVWRALCAGASHIALCLVPEALRFTVWSNEDPRPPRHLFRAQRSLPPPTHDDAVLAVASVASMDVIRTVQPHELCSFRAGTAATQSHLVCDLPYEDRKDPDVAVSCWRGGALVNPQDAGDALTAKRLIRNRIADCDCTSTHVATCVVDVWELFQTLPVRRRKLAETDPTLVVGAVRSMLAAICVAHPQLCLHAWHGTSFNPALPASRVGADLLKAPVANPRTLTLARVRQVLGPAGVREFVRVAHQSPPPLPDFNVTGYISLHALPRRRDTQLLSANKVPVDQESSTAHLLVQRAWSEVLLEDLTNGLSPLRASSRRRHPFALNLQCSPEVLQTVWSGCRASVRILRPDVFVDNLKIAFRSAREDARRSSSETQHLQEARRKRVAQTLNEPGSRGDLNTQTLKRPRTAPAATALDMTLREAVQDCTRSFTLHSRSRQPARPMLRRGGAVSPRFHRLPLRNSTALLTAMKNAAPHWKNQCLPCAGAPVRKLLGYGRRAQGPTCPDVLPQQVQITKEGLCGARVVGQADRKFIIVIDRSATLFAIDQHAASERIHYESYQQALRHEDGLTNSVAMCPALRVPITPLQKREAVTHAATMSSWGWKFEALTNDCNVLHVSRVPCIRRACVLLDNPAHLLEYLEALSAGFPPKSIPTPLVEALALAACHTAVRFGDCLDMRQCEAIVRGLSECDVPFICAHGRPSVVPLLRLDDVI